MALRIFLMILIGLAVGAVAGWQLAPRMDVPRVDKETLLRQRAAEFYAASRRLDKWTMVRMYTPARQFEDAEKLRTEAENAARTAQKQSAEAKREQEQTAASITPESLEVRIERDWATTGGSYSLVAFDQQIPAQLDRTLWVFDAGQWWVYSWEIVERNAYGHQPDFAMDLDPTR
jgi:gas vesicle protein